MPRTRAQATPDLLSAPAAAPAPQATDPTPAIHLILSSLGHTIGAVEMIAAVMPHSGPQIIAQLRTAETQLAEAAAQLTPTVPTAPPVNVDAPYLGGTGEVGSTLNCTMGNWENEPTSYSYLFAADTDALPGDGGPNYVVQTSDAGHTITCTVTATNALGEAAATSNGVAVPA